MRISNSAHAAAERPANGGMSLGDEIISDRDYRQ
jgi:hypothetical protein